MAESPDEFIYMWDDYNFTGFDEADLVWDENISSTPEKDIILVVFAVIFILGLAGNGALIVVFIKGTTTRTVSYVYHVSLVVGNLLILFCVPFMLTTYNMESWAYGEFGCKLKDFLMEVYTGVSIFTLTILSWNCYFAIVKPNAGRRVTMKMKVAIIRIWTLSILLAAPSMWNSSILMTDRPGGQTVEICVPYPLEWGQTFHKVVDTLKFLIYYAIPLPIIAFFYAIMAPHLFCSKRNVIEEGSDHTSKTEAKMVLILVMLYALCFLPGHVYLICLNFYSEVFITNYHFFHGVWMIGFCLPYAHSCLNPFVVLVMSQTYRKHVKRYFCFCCERDVREIRGGHDETEQIGLGHVTQITEATDTAPFYLSR